jgi:vacuolar-type H+-ATPase subunit C/Vma6
MLNDGAYAYAKACGILGKSFLGKRLSSLAPVHTLNDLDRLVFKDTADLPPRQLLRDIEKRIAGRAAHGILSIVKSYAQPPELLIRMLRAYEYGDLKTCIQHIASGDNTPLNTCNIGRFGTVRFEKFPDIAAMLFGTEFAFLIPQIDSIRGGDTAQIETKLDALFYRGLVESLPELPGDDREIVQKLLFEEINLRNCVWALRLRAYYHKSAAETKEYLIDFKPRDFSNFEKFSLASSAIKSLELPLDTRQSWHGWKWEKFLNPEEPSVHWTADPRHFQNAASRYLYRLSFRSFHLLPQETASIFCFIKLKQFEEDLLTSIAEGLSMGMDSAGVLGLLEVS